MGFDCVEVEGFWIGFGSGFFCVLHKSFCDPNPRIAVACADFKDGFCVGDADNLVQKEPGFF